MLAIRRKYFQILQQYTIIFNANQPGRTVSIVRSRFLLLLLAGAPSLCAQSFERIALDAFATRPAMEARDAYKLALQAAFGAEHLGADSLMLLGYLNEEIAGLDTASGEPLIEPISPGGMVRVNLRPYVRAGGTASALVADLLASMRAMRRDSLTMESYLGVLLELARAGRIPLDAQSAQAFFDARRSEGFPAVHHSAGYVRLYRPAYRVLLRSAFHIPTPIPGKSK